jgi:hypothetical protein
VKNKDLQELELFEKSVRAINQQTNDMINFLHSNFVLDENTCHQFTVDIEGLHKFIDIYVNNKFSLPHTGLNLYHLIDEMRKQFSAIFEVGSQLAKVAEYGVRAKQEIDSGNPTFDPDEFQVEYNDAMRVGNETLAKSFKIIEMSLHRINLVIEGDLIKIKLGVDIIDDYKKRQKRLPKNKDLMTEFIVRFKVVQQDDLKYLKKEEHSKNGKSGTRDVPKKL